MEENNNNYFIGTDELILDENINNTQKLLLMKLNALQNTKKYAFCSNEYLSNLFKIHKKSISRLLSDLQKKGYIQCGYDDRGFRQIKVLKLSTEMLPPIHKNVTEYPQECYQVSTEMLPPIHKNVDHNNKENNKENNKDNKRNIKEKINVDEKIEILRNIFKEYYSDISSRFISKKVKDELSKKIKEFDDIEKGFKNFLEVKQKEKTEIKFIKSTHIFIKDEMYKDYLEEVQPTFKRKEEQIISVDDYLNGNY